MCVSVARQCRQTLRAPNAVVQIKFIGSLPVFATACVDAVVRVYDARSGKCAQEFTGPEDSLLSLAVHKKEQVVSMLAGGDDPVARVYRFDMTLG